MSKTLVPGSQSWRQLEQLKMNWTGTVNHQFAPPGLCPEFLTYVIPMDCSLPGFPWFARQLLSLLKRDVHWVMRCCSQLIFILCCLFSSSLQFFPGIRVFLMSCSLSGGQSIGSFQGLSTHPSGLNIRGPIFFRLLLGFLWQSQGLPYLQHHSSKHHLFGAQLFL